MVQHVYSAGLWGIDGMVVSVEADVHDGLPGFLITGNLAKETKEAQERVQTALKNTGFQLSAKKITVNLAPADIRKDGTSYDLAIASAVLGAYALAEQSSRQKSAMEEVMIIGEVGLSGEAKPVRGILSLVSAAKRKGIRRCFLPKENAREGSMVEGMEIIPVESIRQIWDMLNHPEHIPLNQIQGGKEIFQKDKDAYSVDFSELNGQPLLRRATEIAVAGRHNILYIGPAGTGKTMAARRIPTIMPDLSPEESLEISKIYSICGLLPKEFPLMTSRPFRSPHYTITPTALTGGGTIPKPGEISLASGGVLFLDEFPEFSGKVIELLRQPLEDRKVTISRLYGSYTFPANTMLAATMNPCPCGYYPDKSRCRCSRWQIKQYIGKISKPILDRIDITVEASPISFDEFRKKENNESSASIRRRIIEARKIQNQRFSSLRFNGEMNTKEIDDYCRLKKEDEDYLRQIYQTMKLSARGCHKILRVARTIADLDGKEEIEKIHLSEAVSYRSLEDKYWNEKN